MCTLYVFMKTLTFYWLKIRTIVFSRRSEISSCSSLNPVSQLKSKLQIEITKRKTTFVLVFHNLNKMMVKLNNCLNALCRVGLEILFVLENGHMKIKNILESVLFPVFPKWGLSLSFLADLEYQRRYFDLNLMFIGASCIISIQ